MPFKMQFDCDNEAFENDLTEEVWFILRQVRNQTLTGHTEGTLKDSNGNRVGTWELSQP